jgi:hypothetical protein
MPQLERRLKHFAILLPAVMSLLIMTGCLFIPSHEVSVDAISGPTPVVGQAFRVADKDPLVARESRQHKLVFACVTAALETKGFFEAPPGTRVDLVVEVDYGSNRTPGVARMPGMPPTTENFVQLSGRRPKLDGGPGKGEELWNVRITILEERVDLNTLIPVLTAVAADYVGLDTEIERTVKISERQPNVAHVKAVAQAIAMGRTGP